MFTSSLKREIRQFPVVAVRWRQRNVPKCVMHVQSCCFAYSTYCFFWRSRCRRRRGILKSPLSILIRYGLWNYLPMIKTQLRVKQNCLPSISYQTLQTSKMNVKNLLGEHVFKNNNCVRFRLLQFCPSVLPFVLAALFIECFHSRAQHLCKFVGTKESVCIRKGLNCQRTSFGHQHGSRFIVLGHQYGCRDVIWKHSIPS